MPEEEEEEEGPCIGRHSSLVISQKSLPFGTTVRRSRSVRAKAKEESQAEGIFNGSDAIAEVAKPEGSWNWVLLGPDPENLPLSGGGSGGVEEMQDNLGKHPHAFGLLRMSFGPSGSAAMKWFFVNASSEDEGNFSPVQRGRAKAALPKMKQRMTEVVSVSAEVHIKSKADCTMEFLVESLRPVVTGFDDDSIFFEYLNGAIAAQKELTRAKDEEKAKVEKIIEQAAAPPPQAAEPVHDEAALAAAQPAPGMRQRRSLKLHAVGEQVEIYSTSQGRWCLDAEIVEILQEARSVVGMTVRAGSMKVVYDNGTRFKWVAPQLMKELIRASPRPPPPDAKFGTLQLELEFESLGMSASHTERYAELNKGWLQWWTSKEKAAQGEGAEGSSYLLGLQVQSLEGSEVFKIRTEASPGAMYAFRCKNDIEECKDWVKLLWMHATFCDEARDFREAQVGGITMQSELLAVMAQENKQRHSLAES